MSAGPAIGLLTDAQSLRHPRSRLQTTCSQLPPAPALSVPNSAPNNFASEHNGKRAALIEVRRHFEPSCHPADARSLRSPYLSCILLLPAVLRAL